MYLIVIPSRRKCLSSAQIIFLTNCSGQVVDVDLVVVLDGEVIDNEAELHWAGIMLKQKRCLLTLEVAMTGD